MNLTTSSRRSPGDNLLDGNYDSSPILNPSLSTLIPLSRDAVYPCDRYIYNVTKPSGNRVKYLTGPNFAKDRVSAHERLKKLNGFW